MMQIEWSARRMFGIARGGVPGRRRGSRGWEGGQKGKPITRDSKETAGLCQTVCGAFLCSYPVTENARQTLDVEVDYRVCASASPRRLRTMRRTLTKAGLTSTGRQSSRLRQRRRNIPSSLRLSQEKCGAGVPPLLALKPSG